MAIGAQKLKRIQSQIINLRTKCKANKLFIVEKNFGCAKMVLKTKLDKLKAILPPTKHYRIYYQSPLELSKLQPSHDLSNC